MLDSVRIRLLYGPYIAPKCSQGDKLFCRYRNREAEVRCFTEAPISWPVTSKGIRWSLVLCGDLIRGSSGVGDRSVASLGGQPWDGIAVAEGAQRSTRSIRNTNLSKPDSNPMSLQR